MIKKKAYKEDLPDLHMVFIEYLESFGDGELLLEVMPKISYHLEDLYSSFDLANTYDEFMEENYLDLRDIVITFAGEVSEKLGVSIDEVFNDVMSELKQLIKEYYLKKELVLQNGKIF